MAVFPLLGVLVLCLRGADAQLFRGWLPGAFLGCGTLPDKDLRFAHPDFGPATSGSARDSRGRTVR